jgi:hypothetical protein
MTGFDHCLRPEYTQIIVRDLHRGKSINLIGSEGIGRERLLQDIQQSDLPDTETILINLKSYKESYDALILHIWDLMGKQGKKPRNLSELIDRAENKNGRVLLLLNNFDALLDNPKADPKFDMRFYDALNYIRNKIHVALLCVTQKPHDQSVVFINGEHHSNSWLDLEKKHLPQLTRQEIGAEIARRGLSLDEAWKEHLTDTVAEASKPYNLLEFLSEKILNGEDGNLPENARLKRWIKTFKKEDRGRFLSTRGAHSVNAAVITWARVTGLSKLKTPIVSVTNLISSLCDILRNKLKSSKHDD